MRSTRLVPCGKLTYDGQGIFGTGVAVKCTGCGFEMMLLNS